MFNNRLKHINIIYIINKNLINKTKPILFKCLFYYTCTCHVYMLNVFKKITNSNLENVKRLVFYVFFISSK